MRALFVENAEGGVRWVSLRLWEFAPQATLNHIFFCQKYAVMSSSYVLSNSPVRRLNKLFRVFTTTRLSQKRCDKRSEGLGKLLS